MKYLLDTNVCITYLKGRSLSLKQRLESQLPEDIYVCSVVKAELYYGAWRSRQPQVTLQAQNDFLNMVLTRSSKRSFEYSDSLPIPIEEVNMTYQYDAGEQRHKHHWNKSYAGVIVICAYYCTKSPRDNTPSRGVIS